MAWDCNGCKYEDLSPCDDPCYKCLDGYNGRPRYTPKHQPKPEPKKEKINVDEDTSLPWSN